MRARGRSNSAPDLFLVIFAKFTNRSVCVSPKRLQSPWMVARYDNEEISCLALALSCAGALCPLIDLSWQEA